MKINSLIKLQVDPILYRDRLRAGWFGVRIPAAVKNFSLLHTFRPSLETIQPPTEWVSGFFSGSKATVT